MAFKDDENENMEINLDDVFDENGYIINDRTYTYNSTVKKIKLTRTKNTSLKNRQSVFK
jgi:hypothetical protein